jgi:hypothetical protein
MTMQFMRIFQLRVCGLGACCLAVALTSHHACAEPVTAWLRSGPHSADGIAIGQARSTYVIGDAEFGGPTSGSGPGTLTKFDSQGAPIWTRRFGAEQAYPNAVSVDAANNAYIASSGIDDAFATKFDFSGNLLWARTVPGSDRNDGLAIAADYLGNVFIGGVTFGMVGESYFGGVDAFLVKYDTLGNWQWSRQFGGEGNEGIAGAVADQGGNVYVAGTTQASLGNPNAGGHDAFLRKYDGGGGLMWSRTLGTSRGDGAEAVSIDGLGNVYISGYTWTSPNAPGGNAFVSKFDDAGNFKWTEYLETGGGDWAYGVAADTLGNVFISGSLGAGGRLESRAFVSKFDAQGNFQWTHEPELAEGPHFSWSVAADGLGNAIAAGSIVDSKNEAWVAKVGEPKPGDFDANAQVDGHDFLIWQQGHSPLPLSAEDLAAWKMNLGHPAIVSTVAAIPEPSCASLAAAAAFVLTTCWRQARRRAQKT